MTEDRYNLQRFVTAQERTYEAALLELKRGSKASHWMWYIFPQLKGLGYSSTAKFYGIEGEDEARAYLQHEILGPRLITCTQAVIAHDDLSAKQIFGYPDYLKFHSCMTLFDIVSDDEVLFRRAVRIFYNGSADPRTVELLATE
jgi:uncharacterized protein (DUF1810 family)